MLSQREQLKEENAIIAKSLTTMEEVRIKLNIKAEKLQLDNELVVEAEWNQHGKELKKHCKEAFREKEH